MNIITQVGIINLALSRLGETGDLTTISSGPDKIDKLIAATYDPEREYLLSVHAWNFAQKTAELDYVAATISAATNASPVVVTLGAVTAFANNDIVEITDVVGMTDLNSGTYMIDSVNTVAKTFELYNADPERQVEITGSETLNTHSEIDGTAYGTYVSGGQMRLVPKAGYAYAYALPADCISVSTLMDASMVAADFYEVERDRIFTNLEDAYLKYCYQITDDTAPIFSGSFVDVFAWRLAKVWAWPITKDKDVMKLMNAEYLEALAAAKANDANQSQKDYSYVDSFILARG